MRLSRVLIRRFKSITELELRIPEHDKSRQGSADFVSIVGENNAGKSSILEAIRLACQDASKPTKDYFPGQNEANGPIEVELEFDKITEEDKDEPLIQPHIYVENNIHKFRIKKSWGSVAGTPECSAYNPNTKRHRFRDATIIALPKSTLAARNDCKDLIKKYEEISGKKPGKLNRDVLLQAAKDISSSLIEEYESTPWTPLTGGSPPSIDKVLPRPVYVPALEETGAQAHVSEKKSAVRLIVNMLFEQQLSKDERVTRFRRAAADLEQLFSTDSKHRIVAQVEDQITAKLTALIKIGAELQFKTPDVTSDLASRTEFRVRDGEITTRPEHQGHGAQRSIVLALLQIYAEQLKKGHHGEKDAPSRMLFLIEEPEIYMHPEMCRRMRDALLRIAQSGVGQVICTTHSPVFLDLADRHDGIVIIKKVGGRPVANQRTKDVFDESADGQEPRDRLRMTLNFDSAANEVFFAKSVCLVEGDSEIAAVDAIARKLADENKIHFPTYLSARRSVAIINCRGKPTMPAFQKVLQAFNIEHVVVHDKDDGKAADTISSQIQSLASPNNVRVHDRNFELQMFGKECTKDKPWNVVNTIRNMNPLNVELISFFEFVLRRKLADLSQPAEAVSPLEPITSIFSPPSCRNYRDHLKLIDISNHDFKEAVRVEKVFRIAAGPSRTVNLSESAQHFTAKGPVYARVTGESMNNTLQNGDVVVLEHIDIHLTPVDTGTGKMPKSAFCAQIEHEGVYALAINEQYEQGAYTLKRVRIHELVTGGWICQIWADNPDADWGERGQVDIRRTDHVHFAARLIGLAKNPEPSEGNDTEVVFDPIDA
jgi:putative ATP-dependent endonuclease of OLD family